MVSGITELCFLGNDKILEQDLEIKTLADIATTVQFALFGSSNTNLGNLVRDDLTVVATSMPVRLARLACVEGWNIKAMSVNGSVEGYVNEGTAQLGFDLFDTGETIKDNNLTVIDTFGKLTVSAVTALQPVTTRN